MYTFQLANLPPNTLPNGLQFIRDCKQGQLVRTFGYIRISSYGYNSKKELIATAYELVEDKRKIQGYMTTYGYYNKYFIRADMNYSLDHDKVVEVIS